MITDLALSLTESRLVASITSTVRLLSLDLHDLHLIIPAQADKN
jgi:hypothetical protein